MSKSNKNKPHNKHNNNQVTKTENQVVEVKEPETLEEKSQNIIQKIIAEDNIEKTKDYTALFKVNEAKKEMVRINNLGNLGDIALNKLTERVVIRPDEITTKELTDIVNMAQSNKEKSMKLISDNGDNSITQINNTNNSTNINVLKVGEDTLLTNDEQANVLDVVQTILKMAKQPQQQVDEIPEPKVVPTKDKQEGVDR